MPPLPRFDYEQTLPQIPPPPHFSFHCVGLYNLAEKQEDVKGSVYFHIGILTRISYTNKLLCRKLPARNNRNVFYKFN